MITVVMSGEVIKSAGFMRVCLHVGGVHYIYIYIYIYIWMSCLYCCFLIEKTIIVSLPSR